MERLVYGDDMKIYNMEDVLKISRTGIYELMSDIDFNGKPIKWLIDDFRGVLEGNGHSIKNLLIKRDVKHDNETCALINTMGDAVIKNVVFENVVFDINDKDSISKPAVLCGHCEYSTIDNVLVFSNRPNNSLVYISNHSTYIRCEHNKNTKKKDLIAYSYEDKFI